jgi:hypothetical protein
VRTIDDDLIDKELRVARLAALAKGAPTNALATALNSALIFALLYDSAPLAYLSLWFGAQLVGAVWFAARAKRRRRKPRGSARGLRRAVWFGVAAGLTLGCVVLLVAGARDFERFIVFLTLSAMASGASATLAAVPGAARGYVAGVLLPPTAYWISKGSPEYLVLAGLSAILTLYLLRNVSSVHSSFLASVRRGRELAALRSQFQQEMEEWLDLSRATEAFALLDAEGKLLLFNSKFEELVRPAKPERAGSYVELLQVARAPTVVDGEVIDERKWRARRVHQATTDELIEEYTDGRVVRVSTVRLPSGRTAILGVDITQLRNAELAVRDAELVVAQSQRIEMVGTMAGGVAHDFNNLLMAISGSADLLERRGDSPADQELLASIRGAVERGSKLTRQLLAYGRRQMQRPRTFDLNQLLRRIQPLLLRVIPKSTELVLELSEVPCAVRCDPTHLEQVVMNLVTNARDAMPDGGRITVTTRPDDGGKVGLVVADTGTGMDEATKAKVFEPFFTTKERHRGSGLGLAVVQGTVRQSGGSVSVESKPGSGTTITVHLPKSLEHLTELSGEIEAPVLTKGNVHQVLLVDDEPTILKLARRMLESVGYSVITADNGADALVKLAEAEPRVETLLTDVVMPGLSGTELARIALQRRPDLRVVMMTGYDAGALDGFTAGAVLHKPFQMKNLVDALREAKQAKTIE